jgi:eukaryotic-like serine/threonine-protein kinase
MTTGQWAEVERLLDEAMRLPLAARPAFAADIDDAAVRHEVESLLHAEDDGATLDPSSIIGEAARSLLDEPPPGRMIGNFRIIRPIDRGAMGLVFLARDVTLERDVAIKLLPADVRHDRERLLRFDREARAAAALNHPSILTIHQVGTADGQPFIATEFVEGETLAQELVRGPLPLAKTVSIALQVAGALAAAHSHGIVHRDLKPANIMITSTGVKVLDFGLAQIELAGEPLTQTGAVMGTPAYMAPEQWEGKGADRRSDIYALGCIVYEMASGTRAGPSRRPLPSGPLERLVCKCLQLNRADRWQSAEEVTRALQRVQRPERGRWYAAIAASLMVALVGGVVWQQRARPQPLNGTGVLMLADFANTTGDPVFDRTLRQALAIQLEQSPFLKILGEGTVRQDLTLMGRAADAPLTPGTARDICVREAASATVEGSITSLGKAFVITLDAVGCQDGSTVARAQVQADEKEHVLQAVATAATAMRAQLGESLPSIEKSSRPLDDYTTASLEALQTYAHGYELAAAGQYLAAIPFFQRATDLDPTFAMAYHVLAIMYSNSGERLRSNEYERRAFALSDRVSEIERLGIVARYHFFVTGELDKAVDAYQLLIRSFPRYWGSHGELGALYWRVGDLQKSLEASRQAQRLEPRAFAPYNNQAIALTRLGRLDEAKAVLKSAQLQNFDSARLHQRLMEIAYLEGHHAAAEKEAQWFAGNPEEYAGLETQAANEDALGRRRRARELYQRAAQLARHRSLEESAAQFEEADALADALTGNCATVRGVGGPALAFALCGDVAAAHKLAARTSATFPHGTLWNTVELPTIRAAIALSRDDPTQAVTLLASAASYERASPMPDYLRSLAYLRLGKAVEAAEGVQRILDQKGAHWGLVYALSYPALGRAAARAGDTERARKAYADFLSLWEDADTGAPLMASVRREAATLK